MYYVGDTIWFRFFEDNYYTDDEGLTVEIDPFVWYSASITKIDFDDSEYPYEVIFRFEQRKVADHLWLTATQIMEYPDINDMVDL